MFSGIDDTEVRDLNYCLFFILCYSRFIRSGLRKNQDGWQHRDTPLGRLYQEEEAMSISSKDMKGSLAITATSTGTKSVETRYYPWGNSHTD